MLIEKDELDYLIGLANKYGFSGIKVSGVEHYPLVDTTSKDRFMFIFDDGPAKATDD